MTTAANSLSAVLDAAERVGKLNLRTQEIHTALPSTSAQALRQALHRQQKRGRLILLSKGSGHWLIVPLQYANAGAPPLETWLDRYLSKTLGIPYYIALLSAAETYGVSPYAVMVTQVMVPERRRPITVGRNTLTFHTHAQVAHMPTQWHETPEGRFKISTPELTMLELVRREARLGGMARIHEVLRGLRQACAPAGLTKALEALHDVPAAQRLGAMLALDEQDALASSISNWLQGKHLRIVPLESNQALGASSVVNTAFKVRLPAAMEIANT